MIIAHYSKNGLLIESKFLGIYDGQVVTALFLDGSKKQVKISGRKSFLLK